MNIKFELKWAAIGISAISLIIAIVVITSFSYTSQAKTLSLGAFYYCPQYGNVQSQIMFFKDRSTAVQEQGKISYTIKDDKGQVWDGEVLFFKDQFRKWSILGNTMYAYDITIPYGLEKIQNELDTKSLDSDIGTIKIKIEFPDNTYFNLEPRPISIGSSIECYP